MTQAKLCGASLYGGNDGKGASMNLRKQPVNRNASHGNPSKEDGKGNSKKRPQWFEQEASHGRRGNSTLVVFLGTAGHKCSISALRSAFFIITVAGCGSKKGSFPPGRLQPVTHPFQFASVGSSHFLLIGKGGGQIPVDAKASGEYIGESAGCPGVRIDPEREAWALWCCPALLPRCYQNTPY